VSEQGRRPALAVSLNGGQNGSGVAGLFMQRRVIISRLKVKDKDDSLLENQNTYEREKSGKTCAGWMQLQVFVGTHSG
jgi:hypothetical protein